MKPPRLRDTSFARLFIAFTLITVLMHLTAWVLFKFLIHPDGSRLPAISLGIGLQLISLLLTAGVAARFLAEPIAQLAAGAAKLGRNLDSPPLSLSVRGPIEARQAAEVFNQMQDEIRGQVLSRSRFLAAVSHDLRAPLTRMRLRLGRPALDDQRERLLADIEEMTGLLDHALEYLRGGEGEKLRMTDINALVQALADDVREEGHRLEVEGTGAPLMVRPTALRRGLENLVRNALRYAGDCSIALSDLPTALCIEVRDRGPGIPEARLAEVLEPFVCLDESRNRAHGGVGLGLAIATAIARVHGGSLELRNREGGGLVARVTLPRTDAGGA